jgi:hypothetical protein
MSRLRAGLFVSLASFAAALGVLGAGAATASAAPNLAVYVGYADNLRASPTHFPTPWEGSPGVTYNGCSPSSSCTFDGGAIRLVNTGFSPITIDSTTLNVGGCVYDIWKHSITIAGGGQLILAQTASGAGNGCSTSAPYTGATTMDTSDDGPGGAGWSGDCNQSKVTPGIQVTVGGTTTSYNDTGQVLNTGGIDLAECPAGTNESTQWTLIGGPACPSASLTLSPPTQSLGVGQTANVTATLKNSGSGSNCGQPLQGVAVDFTVAGPNGPITGSGTTNASGQATFSYSGTTTGTDTVGSSVTNLAGTIPSNNVKVNWGTLVRNGTFSCRASALRLLTVEPVVANGPDSPCATASAGPQSITILSTGATLLTASTQLTTPGKLPAAGDGGSAAASVASVTTGLIPGVSLGVGALKSSASATCTVNSSGGLSATLAGSSTVASLTINGNTMLIGNSPLTLSVGLATVYLNRQIISNGTITQRALEIDLLGQAVLIAGESTADISGDPCGTKLVL